MKNKVRAFTLFELVVGMLLAAVVIGMVYQAWFIISRVYDGYLVRGRAQSELLVFRKIFTADVDKARRMEYQSGEITLLDTLNEPSLRYQVRDSMVIRLAAVQDTFKLKGLSVKTSFEGADQEEGLIDAINFSFYAKKDRVRIDVKKQYSSEQLFKTTN